MLGPHPDDGFFILFPWAVFRLERERKDMHRLIADSPYIDCLLPVTDRYTLSKVLRSP